MRTNSDVDNTAAAVIEVASTRFGKPISIKRGAFGRLFVVHVAGGGKLPPEFEGTFTDWDSAYEAVVRYVGIENLPYVAPAHPESVLPPLPRRKKVEMPKDSEATSFVAE